MELKGGLFCKHSHCNFNFIDLKKIFILIQIGERRKNIICLRALTLSVWYLALQCGQLIISQVFSVIHEFRSYMANICYYNVGYGYLTATEVYDYSSTQVFSTISLTF